MDGPPGALLASGRAADVYDLGDGTVLRRYRSDHDCGPEARLMQWLHEHGVPVPRVHRTSGSDIVMDRVVGPTLFEDLAQRPWRVARHARTLASLQRRVNALVAPRWLARREGVSEGDAVLHLDLHPMNVLMGAGGPVIIDWTNASRGLATFDAAMSVAVMAAFELDGLQDRVGRWLLVQTFVSTRGRRDVRASMSAACRHRLTDPNVTAGERRSLERLART